jgi:hypothetical protein
MASVPISRFAAVVTVCCRSAIASNHRLLRRRFLSAEVIAVCAITANCQQASP